MLQPYEAFSQLAGLPPLVRKQRTLEAKIVPIAPLVEQESALRKEIDALLVAAGLTTSGEGVTCNGYNVEHHTRKGNAAINEEKLVATLGVLGIVEANARQILADCTERGDPSQWATVKPSKGAKVRR